MNFWFALERASALGVAALGVALLLQWILAARVPASWRIWVWRVALLQTALTLIPLAPFEMAVLPAKAPKVSAQAPPILAEVPTVPSKSSVSANAPTISPEAPEISVNAPPIPAETRAIPARSDAKNPPHESIKSPRVAFDWRTLLLAIYLCGIGVHFILLGRSALRARRLLRACQPIDNAPLRGLAARLGLPEIPRLMQGESGAPFLIGIFRPTIVVPRVLNSGHVEAVLAHELAHCKRRDLAWNVVLWFAQTLLWFHPLAWAARRFHALEVECACDELTLQLTTIAPQSYGALLLSSMNPNNSPLTAGVNDGFFALKTRLQRLGRAPRTPRKRIRILFATAILISFGAALPLKLVSRAQNEKAINTKTLSGIVRDVRGKAVAGARVQALPSYRNGEEPRETVISAADGTFAFSSKVKTGNDVFVDAGARGLAHATSYDTHEEPGLMVLTVAPAARTKLRFVDAKNQPVVGLRVSLRRAGPSPNLWANVPKQILRSMKATTNARGEANFGPLPANFVAQFELDSQQAKTRKLSPIGIDDLVSLSAPQTNVTLRLLPTVSLVGRVTLTDGKGARGAQVSLDRISAARARGEGGSAWENETASIKTDANGNYRLSDLRPGNYSIWVAPAKGSAAIAPYLSRKTALTAPLNRVNFALPRGAVIQGVVTSLQTGKPVKGQTMGIENAHGGDYAITDARGYFRFRTVAGAQRLYVHANDINSPPPGYALPAKSEFKFDINNGQKREFTIALPLAPIIKPIRGVVLNPDGKSASNATVWYRTLEWSDHYLKKVTTDEQGRFVIPPKTTSKPFQLFADRGDAATPRSTIALEGQMVQLKLIDNAWSAVAGQVVDEKKRPVAGARVEMDNFIGQVGTRGGSTSTDAKGNYRFERLRPGTSVDISIKKDGYAGQSH